MHGMKTKGTAKAIPIGLALGGLVSLVVTLAGSAALSHLVLSEAVREEGVGYGSIVILLVGAIMGAWASWSSIRKQRLQICLLSAVTYYLILLGMTALFFGGRYAGMGVTGLVILIGALIVAFFPGKENGKIKRKKRQYR